MKNKVEISISGETYNIVSEESKEYIEKVAKTVEEKVDYIRKNTSLTVNQSAVLTAIQFADDYYKMEQTANNFRGQVAEYLSEMASLRAELGSVRRELAKERKRP